MCRKSKVDKYFIKISERQFNMSAACLSNKYISYSTFKENQFISARTVRIKNLRQFSCQAASVLTIFLIVLYVVYLRIMFEGRSSTTPAPPKRKMGGVLTYEFGKIL